MKVGPCSANTGRSPGQLIGSSPDRFRASPSPSGRCIGSVCRRLGPRGLDKHVTVHTLRHKLEVAEVFRDYGDAFLDRYGNTLSSEQHRALSDIAVCRTAALGGHVEECDQCGHRQIAYNSCRNRHCPKCQATAAAQWMEEQQAE